MIDQVAEVGYAATTATAVYRRAGVSSRSFYENFSDVHDCFMAAYEAAVEMLSDRLSGPALAEPAAGSVGPGGPAEPVVSGGPVIGGLIGTYLEALRSEPAVARTFLVEVYAAGPDAVALRKEVHDRFVRALVALAGRTRPLDGSDVFAIDALVGAVTFQATMRVIAGKLDDLEALRAELTQVALRICPWLEET